MNRIFLLTAYLFITLSSIVSAETLLYLDEDGTVRPGLILSWSEDSEGNFYIVVDAEKIDMVAATIGSNLSDVTVTKEKDGTLKLSGLDKETGIRPLASIKLPDQQGNKPEDVFSSIDSEADTNTWAIPDGSSSLRVKKPARDELDMSEQFVGRVVEVMRSDRFPFADVKIKIVSPPVKNHPAIAMKKGDIVIGRPFISLLGNVSGTSQYAIDKNSLETRENIGAWYMQSGDKIIGAISGKGENIVYLSYLKRIPAD